MNTYNKKKIKIIINNNNDDDDDNNNNNKGHSIRYNKIHKILNSGGTT